MSRADVPSSSGENQTSGVPQTLSEHYHHFDRLPLNIKAVYWFAPYDFVVPADRNPSRAHLIQRVFASRDKMIAKTYGPDHPQIGSRIPERRRK